MACIQYDIFFSVGMNVFVCKTDGHGQGCLKFYKKNEEPILLLYYDPLTLPSP